jgi:hypothetical protein
MKLPSDIEREIKAIELECAARGGQQAGTPRLRGLRSSCETLQQRLTSLEAGIAAVVKDFREKSEAMEREAREHMQPYGDRQRELYCDGKSMALKYAANKLADTLQGLSQG